jgi:ribosomal protein L7Ae-like RNA K-turn-binding protein
LSLAVLACDASQNSVKKLLPLLRARGVTLIVGPDTLVLGAAVGRSAVAVIGVADANLAAGISRVMEPGPVDGTKE